MLLKLFLIIGLTTGVFTSTLPKHSRVKRGLILKHAVKWYRNVVPYEYGHSFTTEERDNITHAMAAWQRETCITFRPRRPSDRNWIRFVNGNKCFSMVGCRPTSGPQDVILGLKCRFFGVIVHELGHVLGMLHEHNRPDRDGHIHVNEGRRFNRKETDNNVLTYGTPYDVQSVMHYGVHEFPGGERPNITDSTKRKMVGNVYHKDISFYDAKVVNLHYRCFSNCNQLQCSGDAYVNKSCVCEGPEEYAIRQCHNLISDTECNRRADIGHCNIYKMYMRFHCRKACNTCFKHGRHGVHIRERPCMDFNKDCADWALRGECEINRNWMRNTCPKSCQVCTPPPGSEPTTQPPPCEDKSDSVQCEAWKLAGNCEILRFKAWMLRNCYATCTGCAGGERARRPCRDKSDTTTCRQWEEMGNCEHSRYQAWMNVNCFKTCTGCTPTAADLLPEETTPTAPTETPSSTTTLPTTTRSRTDGNPSCQDKNVGCSGWAARGECTRNSAWMESNCARSCGRCGSGTICRDTHASCKSWANRGECSINPVWMRANCKMSCNLCPCQDDISDCPAYKTECRTQNILRDCRQSCEYCSVCEDANPDCPLYATQGYCNYQGTLRQCRYSCGMCP